MVKNNIKKKSYPESQHIKHINVELFWFHAYFHLCFVFSLKRERKPPKYAYPCLLLKQIQRPLHYTYYNRTVFLFEKSEIFKVSY